MRIKLNRENFFPIRFTIGLFLVMLLAGCMSPPDSLLSVKKLTVGGIEVVSRNPEVELVMFKTPEDLERYCLAPPPDSVATFGQGIGFSGGQGIVGQSVVSEGMSFNQGEGALTLGGRGQSILITRELMYRACEVAMNVNADSQLTVEIYRETLKAITDIVQSVHNAGVSPLAAEAPDERNQNVNETDEDIDDSDEEEPED